MTNYSKLSIKTKDQIFKYGKRISEGLDKSTRRTIIEVSYGVMESGKSLLSEISRCLREDIPIKKTVERIRRNLKKEKINSQLQVNQLSYYKAIVNKKTIIAVDDTDINKDNSKKLECLDRVRDGSTGDIVNGYNILSSSIVKDNRKMVIPLISNLYSTKEKEFISRNKVRDDFFDLHLKYFDKCLFVYDRGFADIRNLRANIASGGNFVCRSLNRNIIVDDKIIKLEDWADTFEKKYAMVVSSIKNGKKKKHDVIFGVKQIKLEGLNLWAVVMVMDNHEPCVLITSQKKKNMSEYNFGKMVIKQYGCRWSIEEVFRFQKEVLDLENMRVRSISALRNLTTIINCLSAFYPTMELVYSQTRTMVNALKELSFSIKKNVRFRFYMFAKGVQYVLQKRTARPFSFGHYKKNLLESSQLEFL